MEIVRNIKEVEEAITQLEDAVKSTDDTELTCMWWNSRRALLWLVGQYKYVVA